MSNFNKGDIVQVKHRRKSMLPWEADGARTILRRASLRHHNRKGVVVRFSEGTDFNPFSYYTVDVILGEDPMDYKTVHIHPSELELITSKEVADLYA